MSPASPMPPLMKIALDLGPLVVFFLGNSQFGIIWATGAFMIAIALSLSITYAIERKLAPMPLVTGVVVMVFGGLTIYLQDDLFIKLKPTIVNSIFATVLFAGLAMERPLIKYLFEQVFPLTDEGWRKLTVRWAFFFVFLACLNEVVWRNFSTDFWVGFKIWGVFPITVIFAAAQMPLMQAHQVPEASDKVA